ncbi:MAG: ABC transporter substrate-binding protein [Candidatus Bipolaricaulota bacterium]|nr:ABC transporter substrate-binding protein [Candidatus Bipolaricaulota bacterium]
MTRRYLLWVATAVVLALGVYGLAATPPDTLVIGLNHSSLSDFEPAAIYNFEAVFIGGQVYEKLIEFRGGGDAFNTIQPGLAESWERSADGLTWTYKIRSGAKFHSGNPVTAKDVVYSLRRTMAHTKAPGVWILTQFVPTPEMVREVDQYTVAITTNQPIGDRLFATVMSVTGPDSILDSVAVQSHATADDPWADKWLATHDAGSGPYTLKEWSLRDRIVLEAFPGYWRGAPPIKTIIIKDLPEATTQRLALEAGDIDIAMGLLPGMIEELRNKAGISIIETPAFSYAYVAMNLSFEPFKNVKVRQAVRYAIDYQAIVKGIMGGAAQECQTILPIGMPEHSDLGYPHDPDKAKQLLKEAGYESGFDIELLVRTDAPFPDLAVEVQKDLQEIGIRCKVTTMLNSVLLPLFREQKFQITVMRWGLDYPAAQSQTKAFADCITSGPESNIKSITWRCMWCPSGLSDWVAEATAEPDPAKSERLYKAIQAVTLEEGPYAMLFNFLTQIAVRANVVGLEVPPIWPFTDLSVVSKK